MLHLATGDRAVVLGADWGAAVERAAAADPRARVDPARFVRRVRRACTAASVTRAELYRVLGEREGGTLASSAERDGPADAAARTQPGNTGLGGDHADPGTSPRTDDGVPLSQAACRAYEDALVSWGVLQRHPTAREPCFLFGLPGGGPAVRGIIEGRKVRRASPTGVPRRPLAPATELGCGVACRGGCPPGKHCGGHVRATRRPLADRPSHPGPPTRPPWQELVAVLRRRWHGEALESELGNKVRLRHSPLGLPWHVADLLGLGLAQRGSMPIGPVLRLTTRGA